MENKIKEKLESVAIDILVGVLSILIWVIAAPFIMYGEIKKHLDKNVRS